MAGYSSRGVSLRIKCWGARGSVSVSGPDFVVYGGDTTCLEIRGPNDELIIVDAGTGIRRLGNRLIRQGPVETTILFTHAHWDHISGFPFFKPVFKETTKLEVIACAFKPDFVSKMLAYTMVAPYFPVPLAKVQAKISYPQVDRDSFEVGGFMISTVPLSHPNGGVGYKFRQGGKTFVFMTDNELGHSHSGGLSPEGYQEFCQGADLLFHDSEYTPEDYPPVKGYGHSTYTEALELAISAGVKKFGLFHHNQDRTDEQIESMVADCQRRVLEADSEMEVWAVRVDQTIEL